MTMVDFYAGWGGASAAMRDRGWRVITVDINPRFKPDIVADACNLPREALPLDIDLFWASPPCEAFTRSVLPWIAKQPEIADLGLVWQALRLVVATRPRYWILENVKGALPWFEPLLGAPRMRFGSFYLWGDFPLFLCPPLFKGTKSRRETKELRPSRQRLNSGDGKYHRSPALRAKIPYQLSLAVAEACERTMVAV